MRIYLAARLLSARAGLKQSNVTNQDSVFVTVSLPTGYSLLGQSLLRTWASRPNLRTPASPYVTQSTPSSPVVPTGPGLSASLTGGKRLFKAAQGQKRLQNPVNSVCLDRGAKGWGIKHPQRQNEP